MPQLWILKSKGEKASFGGNSGYPDVPSSHYVYDNTVKNYNKLKTGDFIIIANAKNIIGYAEIISIIINRGIPKIRYRCPICNTQEHYERKNIKPKYKCRKKHEFDIPIEESFIVDEFIANYAPTFVYAKTNTSVKILDNYYLKRNLYYSIQAADFSFILNEMPNIAIIGRSNRIITIEADPTFLYDNIIPYKPSNIDDRRNTYKFMKEREGQDKFRKDLIQAYGSYCMITGINISDAIEASHICPYRGKKDNHIQNGLLLRSDLHKLFDADLLGINPDNYQVELLPSIKETYYKKYQGFKLKVFTKDLFPSHDALKERWRIFQNQFKN